MTQRQLLIACVLIGALAMYLFGPSWLFVLVVLLVVLLAVGR